MVVAEQSAANYREVAIRIVVVAINLSYNGLAEETEEERNDEVPGGFIILNDNDNAGGTGAGQGNDTPDNEETAFDYSDPDLETLGGREHVTPA